MGYTHLNNIVRNDGIQIDQITLVSKLIFEVNRATNMSVYKRNSNCPSGTQLTQNLMQVLQNDIINCTYVNKGISKLNPGYFTKPRCSFFLSDEIFSEFKKLTNFCS